MSEGANSLVNNLRSQPMHAALVTATAFSGLASRYLQMLRQFLAETAFKTFLAIGADRVQTSNLLFDELPPAIIAAQHFGVTPKILEELAGQLADSERIQPVGGVICRTID